MERDEGIIGEEGLRFFGRMQASISHELRNIMAVINESAGLLEDFVEMTNQGRPIDPQRLLSVAVKVRRQVGRSKDVLNRMNRLAHSIDNPLDRVDVIELLHEISGLAERSAAVAGVVPQVPDAAETIIAATSAFRLQNIIWLCIDFIIRQKEMKGNLKLQAEKSDTVVKILISPEQGLPPETKLSDIMTQECQDALLGSIGAELSIGNGAGSLVLELPLTPAA